MRRGVWYMGRLHTLRHLNACRSALATGYVRPNASSYTTAGLAVSPVLASMLLGAGGTACAPALAAAAGVADSAMQQLVHTVFATGTSGAALMRLTSVTCLLQSSSISVFSSTKQESFRIESMMNALREECFSLCCPDLTTAALSHDEVHCIDKCAWRYLRTHKILSTALDRDAGKSKKHLL